ncbi:GNAT family N-acetyltransferase [Vibrio algarum]|uniref:GNAT family N-acetyltransferase n=1 Tax=Vibrio algarum TaxID=3020714 RepID=A0ABT4YQR1_9VIBR|nr:GNAT family N-acetyltransferase [Vibrio sp. KJ40-1]MDB1123705.1 GNAT family N-acetyltransferase [Vibrio sp. KJ40-1]
MHYQTFLSWQWIGNWLDSFVDDFIVVEARINQQTVGLGILVKKRAYSLTGGRKNKYYLHRTGEPEEDQIWIEYNDFLLDSERSNEIRKALISRVVYAIGVHDSLTVGASEAQKYDELETLGFSQRKVWETTNYRLDLTPFTESKVDYLSSLSRNSRYQIKRSIRKYQEIGELNVEKAQTVEEAKALLALAEPLHMARWGSKIQGSGFANEKFVQFHKKLIEKGITDGSVELYHIKAGDETIAIMHYFISENCVYFYLCAINYSHSGAHYKPGMVAHYLIIEQLIKRKMRAYDFMGGVARYKSILSNNKGTLAVYQFEHKSSVLSIENKLRELKTKIKPEMKIYQ